MNIRFFFIGWYTIGLAFMLLYHVPKSLQFANGWFLVLYALSVLELDHQLLGKWKFVLLRGASIGVLAFFLEVIGSSTGFPFSAYHYLPTLGYRVLGVPYAMAFAWIGVVTNAVLLSKSRNRLVRAVETGFWVVCLDLVLDPVAVQQSFWVWGHHGAFFGIPIRNFIVWFLVAFGFSFLFPQYSSEKSNERNWAVRLYQLLLLMFGLLAWKDGLPTLFGFAAAVILVTEGRRSRLDSSQQERFV